MAQQTQREKILAAATQVVAEAGLEGVTVRAVAAAVGMGMGTLRHYFPTQRELHAAVVQRVTDDMIQDFDIRDTSVDPGDRLVRCVLQFLPEDTSGEPLLQAWFGLYRLAFEPGANSIYRGFLEVSAQRSGARLSAWLEQLADEGRVRREGIAHAVLLLSALISGTSLEIITPGSAMTVDAGRNLLTRTARGLIAEEDV